jgi:hypothetical protein
MGKLCGNERRWCPLQCGKETLMARNKFETLARAGYGARGVVYLLLGAFALTSAFWSDGATEDTSGALAGLLDLPFGRLLLGLVAIGLMGYVLWKLAQGFLNADNVDDDAKGVLTRAVQLVSAAVNLFLMLTAARLAIAGSGHSSGDGEQRASAWLLQQPFGPYLLGLAAVAVVGAGLVQIWYGASGGYRKRLSLPGKHKGWMDQVCRIGLIARGIVLAIVGGFLVHAAVTMSPERAGGTAEALDYVHGLAFGPWALRSDGNWPCRLWCLWAD